MRYTLIAALMLCASGASAGPLDFLSGIPDAPGVVQGGSFGSTGNDYYGDMHRPGPGRQARHATIAKVRATPARKPQSRS